MGGGGTGEEGGRGEGAQVCVCVGGGGGSAILPVCVGGGGERGVEGVDVCSRVHTRVHMCARPQACMCERVRAHARV